VLQTILLAVVAGAAPTPRRVALVGALAFAAAGCHESAIVLQCGLCALVPVIYPAWRPRRPYLIAIALASVGGGIIDIAAPGNAVRAAYFPPHPSIVWAATQAAGQFWPLLLHLLPLLVAVMGGAALLLPGAAQRSLPRSLAIIPLTGLVAIATIMPAWYAAHGAAPDRNLFFPAAILVAVAIWLGRQCRVPRLARVHALRIACAGIVALACFTNAAPGLRAWNTAAPAYAAWWSALDTTLRRPADPVTRSIGPGGDLGGVVPGSWQAGCVASAYGRGAIRGLWPAR
jgi:hypothetical protein